MDLDYFQTKKSLKPKRRNVINGLIKNSEFITIARSKKYFNELRIDDGFNIDEAENNLVQLIEEILNN